MDDDISMHGSDGSDVSEAGGMAVSPVSLITLPFDSIEQQDLEEYLEALPEDSGSLRLRRILSQWDQEATPSPPLYVTMLKGHYSEDQLAEGVESLKSHDQSLAKRFSEAAKGTDIAIGLANYQYTAWGAGERDSDCLSDDGYGNDSDDDSDASEDDSQTREDDKSESSSPNQSDKPARRRYKPGQVSMDETLSTWHQIVNLFSLDGLALPSWVKHKQTRKKSICEFSLESCIPRESFDPEECWEGPDEVDFKTEGDGQCRSGIVTQIYNRTVLVLYQTRDEVEVAFNLYGGVQWAVNELGSLGCPIAGSPSSSPEESIPPSDAKLLARIMLNALSGTHNRIQSRNADRDVSLTRNAFPWRRSSCYSPTNSDDEGDPHGRHAEGAAFRALLWYALRSGDNSQWKEAMKHAHALPSTSVREFLNYAVKEGKIDIWRDVVGTLCVHGGVLTTASTVPTVPTNEANPLEEGLKAFGFDALKISLGGYTKALPDPATRIKFFDALLKATRELDEETTVQDWIRLQCISHLECYNSHLPADIPGLIEFARRSRKGVTSLHDSLLSNASKKLNYKFLLELAQVLHAKRDDSSLLVPDPGATSTIVDSSIDVDLSSNLRLSPVQTTIERCLTLTIPLWKLDPGSGTSTDNIKSSSPPRVERIFTLVNLSLQALSDKGSPPPDRCGPLFTSILSDVLKDVDDLSSPEFVLNTPNGRRIIYDKFHYLYTPLLLGLVQLLAPFDPDSGRGSALAQSPFRELFVGLIRLYLTTFVGTRDDKTFLHPVMRPAGCGSVPAQGLVSRTVKPYKPPKGSVCAYCAQLDAFLLAPCSSGDDEDPPGVEEAGAEIRFKAKQPIREHIEAQLSASQTRANGFVIWHTVTTAGNPYTLVVTKRKEIVDAEKWPGRVECAWKFLKKVFAGDEKRKKPATTTTSSQVEGGNDGKADGWKAVAQRALGLREWERIMVILDGKEVDLAAAQSGPKPNAAVGKVPMTVQEAREARKRKAQQVTETQGSGSASIEDSEAGGHRATAAPAKKAKKK
ncbi:hypothetical protein BKA70DRAFT_217422 [Coprinopsis sp. MPI-PUGE-AT-0042]|nr:hypothetical protein BKA70DRAFT_217422 [Coprinopsis sp. MPI-PUGE-AT-0042]